MGSPVTLSGFNSIDFNQILELVMAQERLPVTRLESEKKVVDAQKAAFSTLATRLADLASAAEALQSANAFNGSKGTVSDATKVALSASSGAPEGTYDVQVVALARAQVSLSSPVSSADAVVARGGTFTVGGATIEVPQEGLTLSGLASAISSARDAGVNASVVRTDGGYALMLTGRNTGASSGFQVSHALTGGDETIALSQHRAASDAVVEINGVRVTSDTNTFSNVMAGASFTALQETTSAVVLTITASIDSVRALIEKLGAAFRDVKKFLDDQHAALMRGETNTIARDPLVRGLRASLAGIINGQHGDGAFTSLAQVGFSFTRTGDLQFNLAAFEQALATDKNAVQALFRGADGNGGAFGALASAVARYTDAGGLVPNAQERLSAQSRKITDRIASLEERLELRRATLLREFIAADQAMTQLNSQKNSLSSLF